MPFQQESRAAHTEDNSLRSWNSFSGVGLWPPRLPLRFVLVGLLKTKVHSNYPRNKDELGKKSRCVMCSILKARLRRTINVRDKCLQAEGSHFIAPY